MKNAKATIADCRKRGYIEHKGVFYPPAQAAALGLSTKVRKSRTKHHKTGWIDDTRNLANREKLVDTFVRLVKQDLQLDVWPEFCFLADREYRFDYAIPIYSDSSSLKIAIEQEGGVHMKGNSGHSSGTGIMRDMEKGSLASVNGWMLIRRTPQQLCTNETLELIKKAMECRLSFK